TVKDCVATGNAVGFSVFFATLRDSHASFSSDRGIDASASTVEGCALVQNHWGIVAGNSIINHNTVHLCDSDGIRPDNGTSTITDNQISLSGSRVFANGITVQSFGNRIMNNNITGSSGDGITVSGQANILDGNSCIGNQNWGIDIPGTN